MGCLLVTSDWHGDAVTAGLNRYSDIERSAGEVVDRAVKEKVDAFLFLGDLCDPETSRSHRAIALAVRLAMKLAANAIPSLWLTGNHDVVEDGSRSHTLSPLKECEAAFVGSYAKISVIDQPMSGSFLTGELNVVALPFVERLRTYDADKFVRDASMTLPGQPGLPSTKKQRPAIVLSHLSCSALCKGSESGSMRRGRDEELPLAAIAECLPGAVVFQGHYHKRQSWTSPQGVQVHVPGTLERLRFDEEDNVPGFLLARW